MDFVADMWKDKCKRSIWIGFILVIVVGLLVTLFLINKNDLKIKDKEVDKFCTTKGFIETAYDIRRSMNSLVNPCTNFYEYACGNYRLENGQTQFSPREENIRKYNETIEEILNMTSTANDHPVLRYAREVYHGCLAHTERSINVSNVRTLIKKTLNIPNWPIIEQGISLDKNYISEKIAELIFQLSLKPLFDVSISIPSTWTGKNFTLEISEPTLMLPPKFHRRDLNLGSTEFQGFVRFIVELMEEFGEQNSSVTEAQLIEHSFDIILFEYDLFLKTNPPQNKDSYEKLSVLQLDELAGNASATISVRDTLDYLLEKGGRPPLKDDDEVCIFNSTVFSTLLSSISSVEQETLVNYLGYKIAVSYSYAWNQSMSSRRAECLTTVQEVFLPALYSHPHSKVNHDIWNDIRRIFSNVKNELILTQLRNNHLTISQRERILDSIQKIQLCPDKLMLNNTELEEYYSGLYPFEESHLEQMWALMRWTNAKLFNLHGKVQPDNCDLLNGLSGATMHPLFLQIFIPLNVWMEPFYNFEWPAYLKYSGIGSTIGHELMHVLYFINPDLVDTRQCIIDHYEGFSRAPEKDTFGRWSNGHPKINGTRTLQENFCDIGGIQLAYSAYKSETKKMGERIIHSQTELPLLTNYSNDQLFFHNHARGWCDWLFPIVRSESRPNDPHSLMVFRTLGALRNNEDFSEVWKCPKESFMNPFEKCQIF